MTPVLAATLALVAALGAVATASGAGRALDEARVRRRAHALAGRRGARPVRPDRLALAALHRGVAPLLGAVTGSVDRSRRRADRDLPALLDQVTRQLRSGASLPGAVRAAAAGRPDPSTARLAEDLAAGATLLAAVEAWRTASPSPARGLAAAALGLAAEAGGAVAVVLDGVTDTLRDRVALEREVAALSSQSRASAAVLVAAPVVFAVLASSVDQRVARALLGGPAGWACLAGGAALDLVGALWMARLVARAR